jgi:hypothetical protein
MTGTTLSKFASSIGNAPEIFAHLPGAIGKRLGEKMALLKSEVSSHRLITHSSTY